MKPYHFSDVFFVSKQTAREHEVLNMTEVLILVEEFGGTWRDGLEEVNNTLLTESNGVSAQSAVLSRFPQLTETDSRLKSLNRISLRSGSRKSLLPLYFQIAIR